MGDHHHKIESPPDLTRELNMSLHNTIRSPKKSSFDEILPSFTVNDGHHDLNQEEIEEFEKANIEDMGIPVNGVLSPKSHKFSTQDMDGIILDPIAFHSTDNMKDDLQISNDHYEDNLLYISSPSSTSSLSGDLTGKRMIELDDRFSDKGSIADSTASSLFNLTSPANNFLEDSFNDEESSAKLEGSKFSVSNSFIAASNHGINGYEKLNKGSKSVKDEDLHDLIFQYNKSMNKSIISFDHNKNYETFEIEIDDWFISNEFSHLGHYRDIFFKHLNNKDLSKYPESEQDKYIGKLIGKLKEYFKCQESFEVESVLELQNSILLSNTNEIILSKLVYIYKEIGIMQQLTYLLFGNYGFANDKEHQMASMRTYFYKLIKNGFLEILTSNIKKFSKVLYLIDTDNINDGRDGAKKIIEALKVVNEFWFLNLTNFYFILNIFIFQFVDYEDKLNRDFELDDEAVNGNHILAKDYGKMSKDELEDFRNDFLKVLEETKIMVYLVKYIEKWKYNNKSLMKIRNVILLLNKLMMVEFGNIKNFIKVKKYLAEKFCIKTKKDLNDKDDFQDSQGRVEPQNGAMRPHHNQPIKKDDDDDDGAAGKNATNLTSNNKNTNPGSQVKSKKNQKLHAFPLDYYVYSKDLTSRYPAYEPPKPTYPKYLDNNSSLSQFIEVPRTLDNQFLNNTFPVPTIHIATPAASPNSSPALVPTANGKGKRSFQTNQAFPFIYPINNDIKDGNVPYSIKEGSEIFSSHVVESFAKKQLWSERVVFMQQERGWKSSINPTSLSLDNDLEYHEDDEDNNESLYDNGGDEYDISDLKSEISKFPGYEPQIRTLVKIESYYKEVFPSLSSVVDVFVQTIKSNDYAFEFNILKEKRQEKLENESSENENPQSNNSQNSKNSSKNKERSLKSLKQKLEIIKAKEVTLKNISSVISLFMKWFKMSHILKAENLGTVIFDSGFIDSLLNYIRNENFREKLFNDEISFEDGFFERCLKLSVSHDAKKDSPDSSKGYYFYDNLLDSDPNLTNEYYRAVQLQQIGRLEGSGSPSDPDISLDTFLSAATDSELKDENGESKPKGKIYDTSGKIFNLRFCLILNNLFKILQKIILNKTRRLVTFSEKQPVDLFRIIIGPFYNYSIYKSILKVLKEIIPYNGKKWKSVNMDLISLIYINLNLKLKDHWLSGRDIDSEMGDSEGQELALRALIQFYTARKYEEGIDRFGYERRNSDFFGRETDLIASNELNNERND
ncbi:Far11 protein [Saccharomycopsis crataegensis]|uniref:Far11 protein n=1 Tax=Saccharomycopsis crataegensis TaxID=43959 RepID=A0AAV5QT19_9ASCO|nr:Far11 protein [Saccharomycopsis crataegensis]